MTKLIDVVISIDTSTSMIPFIHQLKNNKEFFINRLTSKSKTTNIGIVLHGDYDSSNYLVNKLELTNDYNAILYTYLPENFPLLIFIDLVLTPSSKAGLKCVGFKLVE
jgi:hypothetical protein